MKEVKSSGAFSESSEFKVEEAYEISGEIKNDSSGIFTKP